MPGAKGVATIGDFRTADGKTWEHEALVLALRVLDQLTAQTPAGGGDDGTAGDASTPLSPNLSNDPTILKTGAATTAADPAAYTAAAYQDHGNEATE